MECVMQHTVFFVLFFCPVYVYKCKDLIHAQQFAYLLDICFEIYIKVNNRNFPP